MGRGRNVAPDVTTSCDHIKSQIMLLHGVATAWELSYTSLILAATSGNQLPPWVITTQPTWDKLQGTHTSADMAPTNGPGGHPMRATSPFDGFYLTHVLLSCMHALQACSVPLGDCLALLEIQWIYHGCRFALYCWVTCVHWPWLICLWWW